MSADAVEPLAEGQPSRGRPRDADVDRKIIEAARSVYGERGWAGFSFGAVCRAAGVSKDAMYRRYASREDLLVAALHEEPIPINFDADADLRDQLIEIASLTLAAFASPEGMIPFRAFVDAATNPEVGELYYQQVAVAHVRYMYDLTNRAITEGRFSAIDRPTAFIDGLLGGLIMHVLATPPDKRSKMVAHADDFVRDHVDLILRGAGYDFDRG
ncbi:TetR/AcrR family transcriptional regulator [Gordonia crocea]|nr:TetR/AcrR family transcriptional regulator [Gordonia crocea]